VADRATNALTQGSTPVHFTSREHNEAGNLTIGAQISSALVQIVRQIGATPRWVIAKGDITSNDIATDALGIKRAMVLGQIAPGVSVWECGPETLWPGLPYIVFPGNVGDAETLASVTRLLMNSDIANSPAQRTTNQSP
jgi:uncharacterized protein YgbK (DUF1537 family)